LPNRGKLGYRYSRRRYSARRIKIQE
jgi:hypothetical protein